MRVTSANTPTAKNTYKTVDNQLYRCIVTKILFVDDMMNVTTNAPNPQVIYECAILGGFQEGQIISNCRLASWLGGQFNFAERVLTANSRPLNEVPLAQQDGDIVFVQFIQGQRMAPVIVGTGTQPLDGDSTGAMRDDGPRWIEQYNGVQTSISKDGEYSLIAKGGTLDTETMIFTPEDGSSPFGTVTIDKNKKLTLLTGDATTIELDGTADTIVIKNNAGLQINLSSSGLTIMGGGTTTIQSDTIALNAGMVSVGEGAGFHSTVFENLKSEFESHIHQVPQAMGGILPSQKPLIPLTPTVGSQSVTIKD